MKRLETERLILRKWTLDDASDLYEYGRSDLVGPSAGWKQHKTIDESKDIIRMFIKDGDTLAIVLKSSGKVIGGIGLHDRKPDDNCRELKQLEVGYVLNPDYWGNGFVPEAVERLKLYAFEELELDILWCGHFDFNMNSKRVNEKCGFKYRLTIKQVLGRLDGRTVNTLYYAIENPNIQ